MDGEPSEGVSPSYGAEDVIASGAIQETEHGVWTGPQMREAAPAISCGERVSNMPVVYIQAKEPYPRYKPELLCSAGALWDHANQWFLSGMDFMRAMLRREGGIS